MTAFASDGETPIYHLPGVGIVVSAVEFNKLHSRITELQQILAETYQVCGVLFEDAGRFDDPDAIKVLDNLSAFELVHDDVLPFLSKPKT